MPPFATVPALQVDGKCGGHADFSQTTSRLFDGIA